MLYLGGSVGRTKASPRSQPPAKVLDRGAGLDSFTRNVLAVQLLLFLREPTIIRAVHNKRQELGSGTALVRGTTLPLMKLPR